MQYLQIYVHILFPSRFEWKNVTKTKCFPNVYAQVGKLIKQVNFKVELVKLNSHKYLQLRVNCQQKIEFNLKSLS